MNPEMIHQIEEKLADINRIISSLDPSIRLAAFDILSPYYFDKPKEEVIIAPTKKERAPLAEQASDFETLIRAFDHKRPKDNVLLIAAWLYSQYGTAPISAKEVVNLAGKSGLTIPERADNTMRYAKNKGKSLFRKNGDGWELTVHGEGYVKDTYSVKKGTMARESEDTK